MTTITSDRDKARIYPTVGAAVTHSKRLFPLAELVVEPLSENAGYRAAIHAGEVFQGYLADEEGG